MKPKTNYYDYGIERVLKRHVITFNLEFVKVLLLKTPRDNSMPI